MEVQGTGTLTGQQQAFLYHPGRPVPLTDPQATMVHATMVHGKPGPAQESLHIWEQPLPEQPLTGGLTDPGTYQNQDSVVTMPCRGTMTGTAKRPDKGMPGPDNQSQTGSWKGTNRYYDMERGWVEIPTNNM